jgi:hypothetical protein
MASSERREVIVETGGTVRDCAVSSFSWAVAPIASYELSCSVRRSGCNLTRLGRQHIWIN